MKIGVLSGKGGTGKTFISTNLASVIENSYYMDCDVEEPNGHLFFDVENRIEESVEVEIPMVNSKCIGCKICVDFCKFNALAYISNKLYISEETCHSCGGCILFCPEKALDMKKYSIGKIIGGDRNNGKILSGFLNIGQSSGTAIISSLMDTIKDVEEDVIIDCPPGTACNVMDSIKNTDFCIVVAEPTIFGLHNFKMIEELLLLFNKPFGIIINKTRDSDNIIRTYASEKNIEILKEIPFNRELGNKISNSKLISLDDPFYEKIFMSIYDDIKRRF